ncbi:unnamed protein product [Closterium sp. NIES-53]
MWEPALYHLPPSPSFSEGCSPSLLTPSVASAAAVDFLGAEEVSAASAPSKRRSDRGGRRRGGGSAGGGSGGSGGGCGGGGGGGGGGGSGNDGGGRGGWGGGRGGAGGGGGLGAATQGAASGRGSPGGGGPASGPCPYVRRTGTRVGDVCGKLEHGEPRCFSHLEDAFRAEFGEQSRVTDWLCLLKRDIDIFSLDMDNISVGMYVMYVSGASAGGDYYSCVPISGSAETASVGAGEPTRLGKVPAEASLTFMLDFGTTRCFFCDNTTVTSLSAPVPITLANPTSGPIVARSSTVLMVRQSGSWVLLVSVAHTPDPPLTPPSWSPLPSASPSHALASPCVWAPTVPAPTPAVACTVVHSLRQEVAPRHSSLLISSDHCSSAAHGSECTFPADPLSAPSALYRGGEFASDLLEELRLKEGITQTFTLLASPQQNGITERHIFLIMEVARTSMIHAVAPNFLWPFAVRYATHHLSLLPFAPPRLYPPLPLCPSPSGVSQVTPLPSVVPLEVSSVPFGPSDWVEPATDDTAAFRHPLRLETPPGFPPRSSSPPLQPVTVDSRGPDAVGGGDSASAGSGGDDSGGGDSGGACSRGVGSGGADSGGAVGPRVGGVEGITAGGSGAGAGGVPGVSTGGASFGGAP